MLRNDSQKAILIKKKPSLFLKTTKSSNPQIIDLEPPQLIPRFRFTIAFKTIDLTLIDLQLLFGPPFDHFVHAL